MTTQNNALSASRAMRRIRQQLPMETCLQILRQEMRGVLAVLGDDDYPYALPMDYVFDDATGHLFFHCAQAGHKLDAIRRHEKVSFCVFDRGFRREGEWALNISSVIVFGRMREVLSKEAAIARVRQLGLKYAPDEAYVEEELTAAANRVLCLELVPEQITGKLVNES